MEGGFADILDTFLLRGRVCGLSDLLSLSRFMEFDYRGGVCGGHGGAFCLQL